MKATRSWLDNLKLRASLRLARQQRHHLHVSVAVLPLANYILNGSITGGFAQSILSNQNLSWEKTYMTNFGIDFGLFNNRLNGSFDIYDKNTKGILISLPAPWSMAQHRTQPECRRSKQLRT